MSPWQHSPVTVAVAIAVNAVVAVWGGSAVNGVVAAVLAALSLLDWYLAQRARRRAGDS